MAVWRQRHEEAEIQGESQMMRKTRDWSDTSTSQGVTGNDCAGLGQGVVTMKESFSSGFRVSVALLIPPLKWRRKWQPITVFLPGESHGQWRLAGYSPWSRKDSDMTE